MVPELRLGTLPPDENSIIVNDVGTPGAAAARNAAPRDHAYHPLRIGRVVTETPDTRSYALDVPDGLAPAFAYEAGQFCTFRIVVAGVPHIRCYSMSSCPATDDELTVTVKRVPDGIVSNWMNDSLDEGAVVEVASPAGFFQLDAGGGDVVAFAAGSGITPVYSLIKSALATTPRRVRLLYANRHRRSVIFAAGIERLVRAAGDQLTVAHRFDVEDGFVDAASVRAALDGARDATCYVCGPAPFMAIVERALLDAGVPDDRIHIERFTPADPVVEPAPAPAAPVRVTIELGGRTDSIDHRAGTTILQTAREMGMSPPFSCEAGSCATCMARVVDGAVTMRANNALTPDEVVEGWILTCQSVPATPSVRVVYE
jgi:ferredoxin-NADP reductase